MSTNLRLLLFPVSPLLVSALLAFRPAAEPRETREVPTFTAVQLGTSVTVVLRQGSPQRVVVEAAPEDRLRLATTVVDGQLRIETEPNKEAGLRKLWQDSPRLGPTTVYVTVPTVRRLGVSSSGRLQADTLSASNLALAVSSSGRLLVGQVQAGRVRAMLSSSGQLGIQQLRADTLEAAVSSSGGLTAAGTCAYSSVGVSSSGRLNTAGLAVEVCQARISGSGSCQVNVARTLDARLSSSGSLLGSGHPQITSHVSGSGRVRQQ
jgi:hypothetical protein